MGRRLEGRSRWHVWTGFIVHCYLLTLFLGQGAKVVKISSLISLKGEEAWGQVMVMGPVCPTGCQLGGWLWEHFVDFVIFIHGRGSYPLPHAGLTHFADCGGTSRNWQRVSRRQSPLVSPCCSALNVLDTAFSLTSPNIPKPQTVFQLLLLGQPHSTILVNFIRKEYLKKKFYFDFSFWATYEKQYALAWGGWVPK